MQDIAPTHASPSAKADDSIVSDFNCHRQLLLTNGASVETWGAEVRRYLKKVEEDVMKETDIVAWWQVSYTISV